LVLDPPANAMTGTNKAIMQKAITTRFMNPPIEYSPFDYL